MKRTEFVKLCAKTLREKGFTGRNDNFFRKSDNGVILTVWLHRSFFDNYYYIEFAYSFSELNNRPLSPKYNEADVRCGKIRFGFPRAMTEIHYFETTPEDFLPMLSEHLDEIISAADEGKEVIVTKYVDVKPCSKAILSSERVADFLGVSGCKHIRVAQR